MIANVKGGTCGDPLRFESIPAGGTAPYTYSWSGPNSFSSTDQDPENTNPTLAHEGSYVVTVIDANGCEATSSVQVNGITDELIQPIIEGGTSVCEGDPFELSTMVYSGTSVSYEWEGPLGTTTSGGDYLDAPTLNILNADGTHVGIYRVIVTVDGCQNTSNEIEAVSYTHLTLPTICSV